MPERDPDLLDELRAVFRDELEEWIARLEQELTTLRRQEEPEDRRLDALREIRRAAHTLKGASRVVGEHAIEQTCHQLESELPRPDDPPPLDLVAAAAVTERALTRLRAARLPQAQGPPAREPPTAPDLAPATDPGTLRVSASRLGRIATLSEELLVAASLGERLALEERDLDALLTELDHELAAATRARPELGRARALLERVVAWKQRWQREDRLRWHDVSVQTSTLGAEIRALQATRFDLLAPTLERTVQDVATDLGKDVRFELIGGDAELDRRVVDRLREPLVHLLRNAVDHGIEPPEERTRLGKPARGRVSVSVRAVGTDVVLHISDDGRGIDLAALRQVALARGVEPDPEGLLELLFEPGVTTRDAATTLSGRGIGLEVVRHRITELQGRVRVEAHPGEGAHFMVTVPGDLSVARAVLFRAGGEVWVLGEGAVARGIPVQIDHLRLVEGRPHVVVDGRLIPAIQTAALLGHSAEPWPPEGVALLVGDPVSESGGIALVVDEILGLRQVVIKPLGPRVRRAAFVTGASVLSDGSLACVLDPLSLVRYGRLQGTASLSAREGFVPRSVLVVDDSVTTRQLLASILKSAGYRVQTAVDGEDAWQRLLSSPPPDVVVTDIEMPRVDGFQLLARLKRSPRTADIPVVLVTALASATDQRRALELGADAYVVKGRFDQAALIDTLEELLP